VHKSQAETRVTAYYHNVKSFSGEGQPDV
jgi:hypothetical protein